MIALRKPVPGLLIPIVAILQIMCVPNYGPYTSDVLCFFMSICRFVGNAAFILYVVLLFNADNNGIGENYCNYDTTNKMEELEEIFKSGIITAEEYEIMKENIQKIETNTAK